MKSKIVKLGMTVILFITWTIISSAALAQTENTNTPPPAGSGKRMHGNGRAEQGFKIPDLTADQKASIEKIMLTHKKEMLTQRNLVGVKKAELKVLMTADKADMSAINKKIDEISVLKTDMAKKQAATHQDIRKLLNDKQRLWFDTHPMKKSKAKMMRPKREKGFITKPDENKE